MTTISERLSYFRKKRGLKYREIAQKMGKGESQVQRWFRGENTPEVEHLVMIAGALGVTVGDLIGAPGDHDCARALGLEGVAPITNEEVLLIEMHRELELRGLGAETIALIRKMVVRIRDDNRE